MNLDFSIFYKNRWLLKRQVKTKSFIKVTSAACFPWPWLHFPPGGGSVGFLCVCTTAFYDSRDHCLSSPSSDLSQFFCLIMSKKACLSWAFPIDVPRVSILWLIFHRQTYLLNSGILTCGLSAAHWPFWAGHCESRVEN